MAMPRNLKSADNVVVPFSQCPAKTFVDPVNGNVLVGRSVFSHCQIVGEVARELVNRLPVFLRKRFPEGAHFAAACHDIGKVSPTFYEKLRRAAPASTLSPLPSIDPETESQWGGHAGVSQVSASAMGASRLLSGVLGQHHGSRPNTDTYRPDSEVFGGKEWQAERVALVASLKDALVADWPDVSDMAQGQLLSGLTSVSDWIGSGSLFHDPESDWRPNIKKAVDEAGFIPPRLRHGLSFADIFGFSPNSSQVSLANSVIEPGVYVLEAPMGLGKTEAALYAAYRMMDAGKASGIYFALPTQLTSNKLYERFTPFLGSILESECIHRRSLLLHGQAWLMQGEMGEEGCPGGSWFQHSKRGLLAPFAVGTVDQALMAAMNVKHGFVRAFGLAGKVVILDEVHSYDIYTGTILNALVNLLRSLGCTVIILSATLAKDRREDLLNAAVGSHDYPLITALPEGSDFPIEIAVTPPTSRKIDLKINCSVDEALDEAIARAGQGQQVLWVENTVGEAQSIYKILSNRCAKNDVQCGLLHSRFTQTQRQINEDFWVSAFGKDGWTSRNANGRILIGTQVLEQSLDIDADFLVTRFCPTDMILQRFGRLWRHSGTPRSSFATPDAWIMNPSIDAAIPEPGLFGNSSFVYDPYVLCRSLQTWNKVKSVVLPDDIRDLIEDTYAARKETGHMRRWLFELENGVQNGSRRRLGRQDMQRLAQISLAVAGQTNSDVAPSTRYSEQDTTEVLLLRKLEFSRDEKITRLTLVGGDEVLMPTQRHRLSPKDWRKLSMTLMSEVIKLRPSLAPPAVAREKLKEFGFHHVFYLGSPPVEDALIRVVLVADDSTVSSMSGHALPGSKAHFYRTDLGYEIIKKGS